MPSEYLVTIYKFLPILIMISIGNIMRKLDFLDRDAVDVLKKIVVNVGLPALLLVSFSTVSFEMHYLGIFLFIFLFCLAFFFVGKGFRKILSINSPYFPFLVTGFEAGMLGVPIYSTVFGKGELFKFAILDFGHEVFIFLIFVALLMRVGKREAEMESPIKRLLKTPPIIGVLLGLLIGTLGIFKGVPEHHFISVIKSTLEYFGALVVPLICLVIGHEMGFSKRGLKKAVSTTFLRIFIMLVIALLLGGYIMSGLFGMGEGFEIAFVTLVVLPPPFVIPIFMESDDPDEREYVSNTLSFHTTVTLITYILLLLFWF